jgi:formiminotetrahydrofolate cyclodeaminase
MYMTQSIKKYLDDLAAKSPVPGGGSAAALSAAIGVSLISMVANYTAGNQKYLDFSERASVILAHARTARARLEELVDEDVEAYGRLSKALKENGNDKNVMERAYKEAITPPFEVCRISAECMSLCDELAEHGNKNLITDTAIAVILLEGAFFSAKYNVYINLKDVSDMEFIGSVHNVLQPLEEKLPAYKEEILEKCEDVISK